MCDGPNKRKYLQGYQSALHLIYARHTAFADMYACCGCLEYELSVYVVCAMCVYVTFTNIEDNSISQLVRTCLSLCSALLILMLHRPALDSKEPGGKWFVSMCTHRLVIA